MFCGGIFALNLNTDDLFICSDGVDMNQKELLNITRGVISLLHSKPLKNDSRRVLFIEAATTYLVFHRGIYLDLQHIINIVFNY